MIRALIVVTCLAGLAGCVSTKTVPMDPNDVAAIRGGTITVTAREKPGFGAMTAGKAMFGAIGGVAMVAAGNEIVQENDVEDPAAYIAEQLAARLSDIGDLALVESAGVTDGTKPADLARQYPDVDVLLDVQTASWGFSYFPMDWNSYRVTYSAKMRLIAVRDAELLAEGFCSRIPEKSDDAPSHDELLANRAERLKQELSEAAAHCVEQFQVEVLGPLQPMAAAR